MNVCSKRLYGVIVSYNVESYYWEGCRMDETANRVGYKTADSVKSRKNKVLRRMMVLMSKDREGSSDDELPSSFVIPEAA